MFCNYCGAPNPDVALFCNGCGKPIARPAAAAVLPISEMNSSPLTAASAKVGFSPTAERLVASVIGEHAVFPGPHTLSTTAREEFEKGLATEVRKNIEDKAMPFSIAAGLLVLILLAAVNMVLACIVGLVAAGIVYKVVSGHLAHKQLDTIRNTSDEMLVTRYNEAKADRRAARIRAGIGWAVMAIIGVLVAVAWLASHRE
jgi:hypothetical protein